MNIYIGNLSEAVGWEEVLELFSRYGQVDHVFVAEDKRTGKTSGFGFIEMPDERAAKLAMADLNGTVFAGQTIQVKTAYRGWKKRGRVNVKNNPIH